MKIIDYKLLETRSALDLNSKVCEHLREGWQPFHAPYIENTWYYQALVLYQEQTTGTRSTGPK